MKDEQMDAIIAARAEAEALGREEERARLIGIVAGLRAQFKHAFAQAAIDIALKAMREEGSEGG